MVGGGGSLEHVVVLVMVVVVVVLLGLVVKLPVKLYIKIELRLMKNGLSPFYLSVVFPTGATVVGEYLSQGQS